MNQKEKPVNQQTNYHVAVYLNPSGDYAARLIDSAHLKDLVSEGYIFLTNIQIILLMMVQVLIQIS